MRVRRACNLFGPVIVHGVETLSSALEQDADQIDQHVRVACRHLNGSGVAYIDLHRMDLPDAPERLQVPGKLRPAHRHADAVAAAGERAHHVAAEKARAAIDGDQRVGSRPGIHGGAGMGKTMPAISGAGGYCTDPAKRWSGRNLTSRKGLNT